MRKNCSSEREKLLKFMTKGQEFAKLLEQFIQTEEVQKNFCQQNAFLTFSWGFLMS